MKRIVMVLILCCIGTLLGAPAWSHEDEAAAAQPGAVVPGTGFEGRVVVNGAVLPGAKVYAYNSFADFVNSNAFAASTITGDDGRYKLDLPLGSYYLVAKKRPDLAQDGPVAAGDFFAFQGSNPITVAAGKYTHVGFSMLPYEKAATYSKYDNDESGGLTGKVTLDGEPVDGVYVTLYLDASNDLRGSTYATSPPTGKSGVFRFDFLPEVEYFIVARKRAAGGAAGPLADGDYFGFYPANPLHIKSGKMASIEIPLITKAGEIGQEDSLFRDTGTGVSGMIRDADGKPVEGVYVFGYHDKVMAHKRPEFISKAAGKDGHYTLYFPKGGTYYIGARSKYGDTPALGEWYGRWEGTGDHSVALETGQVLEGIDITVEQILP